MPEFYDSDLVVTVVELPGFGMETADTMEKERDFRQQCLILGGEREGKRTFV